MSFNTFIKGFLILLLTPIVVIGSFAAYTHWINARPSSGLLHCDVTPRVVLTGDQVQYLTTFYGDRARPSELGPPPPLDIMFAVDTSGSMHESLEDMKKAARTVTNDLVSSFDAGHIRFALSQFHDDSEIKSDWSADPSVIGAGLDNLDRKAGNSGTLRAFEVIEQLVRGTRSDAIKVVVLYTDGDIGIDDEIERAAEALRRLGVIIYSISPPGFNEVGMARITGDASRVLRPATLNDLVRQFGNVADEMIGLYGNMASLTLLLDSEIFPPQVPLDPGWRLDKKEPMQLNIGPLSFVHKSYPLTVVPETIGQWRVGLKPATIDFFNHQFKPETLVCNRRPALLVLSVWLLVLLFLPALLWLLHGLLNRKATLSPPPFSPLPIRTPFPPSPLPLPVAPPVARKPVVPSLFVGLGGTGRQALLALKEQLRAAHGSAEDLPYRFVWLDLDAHESKQTSVFTEWNALATREAVAPKSIRQVGPYLDAFLPPQSSRVPDYLTWFRPIDYRDCAADRRDLSKGSTGQRALARFALFRWLEQGDLLTLLQQEHQALLQFESQDELRQIVLIADRTGGVGSAWSIDIARLMRRIGECDKPSFGPQIITLLCDSQQHRHGAEALNRHAFAYEMESAQMAGAYPQMISYGSSDPLLKATDQRPPVNYQFALTGHDTTITAQHCANLCALLVERYPRYTVLNNPINRGQIMSAEIRCVHVLPDLDFRLVQGELMLRLLGPDILLDLEPSNANDRLSVAQMNQKTREKLLDQWLAVELSSTPWRCLLNAALSGFDSVEQLLERAKAGTLADCIWFRQAFSASLNHQLHGQQLDGRWQRGWMPGQAVVLLRLFAQGLEQNVKPHSPSGSELMDVVNEMIRMASAAAETLEAWLDDFNPLCIELSDRRKALLKQRDERASIDGHRRIDLPGKDEKIAHWADQTLRKWTGSEDTVALMRERIFFATRLDSDELNIILAIHIDPKQECDNASAVVNGLSEAVTQAVRYALVSKVESAMGVLVHDNKQGVLRDLADGMVGRFDEAEQVTRVVPTVEDPLENAGLREFIATIKEPPGGSAADDCYGDDHSAVRRLALLTEKPALYQEESSLPFVQVAEQAAEAVRLRAIRRFNLKLPIFPAALRIALAHEERFHAFSMAYKAGHIIIKKNDESGIEQWYFTDQRQFITFDEHDTLADATANFVYLFTQPFTSFDPKSPTGDFSLLDRWLKGDESVRGEDDLSVLVAMRVSER